MKNAPNSATGWTQTSALQVSHYDAKAETTRLVSSEDRSTWLRAFSRSTVNRHLFSSSAHCCNQLRAVCTSARDPQIPSAPAGANQSWREIRWLEELVQSASEDLSHCSVDVHLTTAHCLLLRLEVDRREMNAQNNWSHSH